MMGDCRAIPVWLLVMGFLVLAPAAAQDPTTAPIPDHPRELRFAEQELVLPSPDAHRHQLANGLVVYLVEDPSLPLVDVELAVRAGGYLDPPEQAGLAYLTAALMRRGGTRELAPEKVDEELDFLGAQLDAVSQVNRGGLVLSTPSWELAEAFELFWDVALEPRFDAVQLDHAKDQLRAAMARRHDDPRRLAEQTWSRLLFGETSAMARDLTPTTLDAITRDDLLAFHRQAWRPANMVLAVSGDVDRTAFLAELEERWRQREPVEEAKPLPWPPHVADDPVAPGIYTLDFAGPQTQIILGHRLPQGAEGQRREPAVLRVLAEILGGGGAIARLAGRLRTAEGLAYQVHTALEAGPATPDHFRVSFAVANANVARALQLVLEELARLRREPVSQGELQTARREVLEPLRQAFDSAHKIAGHFAEDHLLGRPQDHWRQLAKTVDTVDTVDARQVRRLAAELLQPDQLIVLLVGPWREIEAGAKKARIDLRRLAGDRLIPLPGRDPLTLEPRGP